MNKMDNIVVISQNVKLESLSKLKEYITPNSETLIVSTQLIFENEAELIDSILECKCKYINFSDLLTDAELEACDVDAFHPDKEQCNVFQYYEDIKILKNERIISKIEENYSASNKLIVCNDLGIHLDSWITAGFTKVDCDYYYTRETTNNPGKRPILSNPKIHKICKTIKNATKHIMTGKNLSVAFYKGQKYVFFGSMNRIAYRLIPIFRSANRFEYLRYYIDRYFNTQPNTIRLSTLHEGYKSWKDRKDFNVRLIQDGYLPPNYGSNYLYFYGKHTVYYTWDVLGQQMFNHFHLPCEICPIRRNLYLTQPIFPTKVSKILVATSGAGDWTAIKNRSDEDKMLQVFGRVAKTFPDIEFIYRCHPVWINPEYQGVNSISRAAEYLAWLKLPNIKISSNIPNPNEETGFRHSFSRSSFEEDLNGVDVVFGEHSIAMLDGGFSGKLFCSVNVTGRRNLFEGITELGFPHCESEEEIVDFLKTINSSNFKKDYLEAVNNYNTMIDE